MRTTIRLDNDLLARVKQIAARRNKTLTSVIEESLLETLARQQEAQERAPVNLRTVSGKGLQPGVDLDDSAALHSVMEESDDHA
jgi:predicted DNA-binding ribbon-helix-helix protein